MRFGEASARRGGAYPTKGARAAVLTQSVVRLGLAAALLGVAAPCAAHPTGVSSSELALTEKGDLEARFIFALADVARLARTPEDLAARLDDGLAIAREDGAACARRTPLRAFDEGDGVALEGVYACGAGIESVTATLYFLSDLPDGHRHVASLSAGRVTSQRLLGKTARAIGVEVPRGPEAPVRPSMFPAFAAGSLMVAVLAALLWGRHIVTRKRVTMTSSDARAPTSHGRTAP